MPFDKIDTDDSLCAICQESKKHGDCIYTLTGKSHELIGNFCGHSFHSGCLTELIQKSVNSNCPLCRSEVTVEDRMALVEAGCDITGPGRDAAEAGEDAMADLISILDFDMTDVPRVPYFPRANPPERRETLGNTGGENSVGETRTPHMTHQDRLENIVSGQIPRSAAYHIHIPGTFIHYRWYHYHRRGWRPFGTRQFKIRLPGYIMVRTNEEPGFNVRRPSMVGEAN